MASKYATSPQLDFKSGSGGAPVSFFGGNQEVYSSLDSISFQGSFGDGSMVGNTAYITLWNRDGAAVQSAQNSSTTSPEPPTTDQQTWLSDGFSNVWSDVNNIPDLGYNFDSKNLDKYTWNESETRTFANLTEFDFTSQNYGEINLFTTNPDLAERRKALSVITPETSKAGQITPQQITTPPAPKPFLTQVFDGLFGGIFKSANPNGGLYYRNAIVKPYSTAPGKIKYSGSAGATAADNPHVGATAGKTTSTAGPMMWQFLFNPSELELDMGPEFKNAETWGVSDKANSGQPLHWSNNKNVELKFNSILLNGFVFGKKVEALEQGLIELFMARDGQGQHGPHILKFVWGRREFGPCVIKNINIREKMWDDGLVVNAELSFTLEQVPEWTINDGFVDVARPGKIGIEGNPVTNSTTNSTNRSATAPTTPPAATSRDQKPTREVPASTRVNTYDQQRCQRAYYYTGQFYKHIQNINNVNFLIGTRGDFSRISTAFLVDFQSAVTELGSSFASQSRATEIKKRIDDILNPNRSGGRYDGGQIKGFINGYINEAINKATSIAGNTTKCPKTSQALAQRNRT